MGLKRPAAAVAVRYRSAEADAPRVLASGRGEVAQRIVELAQAAGVPVWRDGELAKALLRVEVGEEIPPALYAAVAHVLAFLLRADRELAGGDLGE